MADIECCGRRGRLINYFGISPEVSFAVLPSRLVGVATEAPTLEKNLYMSSFELYNIYWAGLVYKACECLCGHGHIRKDLDWVPNEPQGHQGGGLCMDPDGAINGGKRKRKKSKSSGTKPSITIGLPNFSLAQVRIMLICSITLLFFHSAIKLDIDQSSNWPSKKMDWSE